LTTDSRSEDSAATAGERRGSLFPLLALVILAIVILVTIQMRRPRPQGPFVGLKLPAMEAAGWLNTDGPLSADDLRGKVVLVDFWATTCPPCRHHMPELVEFHQQFQGAGLKVVGLTPEPEFAVDEIKRYVESVEGLDFAIGYGAGFVYEVLGVRFTPTYILFDRTGRSVWGGHSLGGLEEAAVEALAEK
jgi:thiol-disulfide isomerase/thioredoxin